MDEIVCANTAFRYWRCPPQVRDLYPRLPNSEDGWRALSQAPFVVDVLKVPIITSTEPGGVNYHSGLRTTIHCGDASGVDSTLETATGFRVTNPLTTLFTMARFTSQTDLVLAMYEFCGWFSVFEPTTTAEAELSMADDAAQDSTTESLFELDESQDEAQWKRVYARVKVKEQVYANGTSAQKKTKEVTKLKGTSLWMRKPLIELHELHEYASKMKKTKVGYEVLQRRAAGDGYSRFSAGSCRNFIAIASSLSRRCRLSKRLRQRPYAAYRIGAEHCGAKSLLRGYRDRESIHNEGRHRGASGRGCPWFGRRARPRCQTHDSAAKHGI